MTYLLTRLEKLDWLSSIDAPNPAIALARAYVKAKQAEVQRGPA